MNPNTMFKPNRLALALTVAMGLAGQAVASETSSSMRGTILGPNGQPVTDAKITILHQPTGTVTEVAVNESGAFVARGLRVGGPYTVIVDSEIYQDDYQEGIQLNLGETFNLRSQLRSPSDVERIVVTGSALPYRTVGSNSEFSEQDIANAPGINRDLKDVARQNPLVTIRNDGAMVVAGTNPKFNSLVVDGIQQNDDFGLNNNGYPTLRSPISIDAVEQLQVNINPFSARYGGFSGAQLNAVTKSGTNEVTGSLFFETTSDSLSGDFKDPESGEKSNPPFSEDTYGFTLGMPLIKDKLFFFGSYEKWEADTSSDYGHQGSGAPIEIGVTQEDIDRVHAAAMGYSGLDIGGVGVAPVEEDEKILAKLDWNISDDHRASYTFQQTKGNVTKATNNSSGIAFSSYTYDEVQELTAHAVSLYSDWSNEFSTDLKVSHKNTFKGSNPYNRLNIGSFSVRTDSGDYLNFGTERSRQLNELETDNLEVRFVADYLIGDHNITAGIQYNKLSVFNAYFQDVLGHWSFDSVADFEQGNVGSFTFAASPTGNLYDNVADFDLNTTAFFVEDMWDVTADLRLTAGVRVEHISVDGAITPNDNFYQRYGYYNTETLDGNVIVLPRIGATYTLTDDVTLKGGIGRYSGGQPNVWIANSYQNSGVANGNVYSWDDSWNFDMSVPDQARDLIEGQEPNGVTASLDPDFDLPSDWRASIGVDTSLDFGSLGDDWYFGAEYIYIRTVDGVHWVDLAREDTGKRDFTGRIIYDLPYGDHYDIMLTNSDIDGYSHNVTLGLSKEWDNGIRFSSSYTYSDVQNVNSGTSSTPHSSYMYPMVAEDRNSPVRGPSHYSVPHRIVVNFGYDVELFSGYNTGVNLFYEGRSGNPYSYVYSSYRNGEYGDQSRFQSANSYLAYIPTQEDVDAGRVVFDGGLTADEFFDAIDELGLGKYAGGYAEKGAAESPWVHTLDLRFTQQIPGFMKGHRGELYFDIVNVLNLLNSDWGLDKYVNYGTKELVDFSYDAANDVLTYRPAFPNPDGVIMDTRDYDTIDVNSSRWQMKLGVRYRF
ncbi:TonB-dependent receptor [Ferrimonas marina]|uniref:TonB-dependent Receptor Plug Domain n=1 Tax=Ferrimonas marina TaxID=299255 RepID=A0A1M5QXN7_9GAMM|nr:TonB-dependent receptor [Ferrimonas marina]SHH18303.1 TonB-dependent Receptor Plug Domain [Ferrimonas marina]